MIFDLNNAPGDTPLSPEDAAGLIPSLASQRDLNEWEAKNILAAHNWAFNQRVLNARNPVDEIYVRDLHRKMFGRTWKWAGTYRKTNLNLGCPYPEIYQRLPVLLGNVRYWLENKTYEIDEIAVRFHYQLVFEIHAFPNGNGRHARLIADILAVKHGRPKFSWGRVNLVPAGAAREAYLAALRSLDADNNNIRPLMDFARPVAKQ